MDANRFKPDSSFLRNKCAIRRFDGGVDRISQLPDKIKVHILSFLPMKCAARTSNLSSQWLNLWKHSPDKISQLPNQIIGYILSFLPLREAARTSILSSRWIRLWNHIPNLKFYDDILKFNPYSRCESIEDHDLWDADDCKYIDLVSYVLQSHRSPSLKQFSVYLYVNKSARTTVARWIEYVSWRGVERLELDFRCHVPSYQVVLEELLRWNGLRLTDFKSLKTLALKCFVVSGEAIGMLLPNCTLLETLIIGFATLTSDVEICGESLMLKRLEVYCCDGNKSMKVSAPNLTSLVVDDRSGKLLLENVPKLVEADFEFRSRCLDEVQHLASVALSLNSQLKRLKLTIQWPEGVLANVIPRMYNLKKLVVNYHGLKTHSLLPVIDLVWASPLLEEFKLVFTGTGIAPVQVVRNVERSPHQHLKLLELCGCIEGGVHLVELVTHISDNCAALEKIVIRGSSFAPLSRAKCEVEVVDEVHAALDYAKLHLEGKLPQHIQLQLLL